MPVGADVYFNELRADQLVENVVEPGARSVTSKVLFNLNEKDNAWMSRALVAETYLGPSRGRVSLTLQLVDDCK